MQTIRSALLRPPLTLLFRITGLAVLLAGLPGPAAAESAGSGETGSSSWADPDVDAYLRQEGAAGAGRKSGEIDSSFGLFGDVTYKDTLGADDDKFTIGQLVVHGLADFGNGFGSFFEVTINSDPEWETRVERLQLFWENNDYLKLSLGRFHVPVTWWNSTFHHGAWLQTTTRRPIMVGFDSAFIPNHAIGLIAEGFIPGLEDAGVRYLAGVSGGDDDSHHSHDSSVMAEPVDAMADDHADSVPDNHLHSAHPGPENHQLMPMAGILIRPPTLPRLQLGTVAYAEKYEWDLRHDVDYLAVGAHAVYSSERPEIIVEYVRTMHEISGHPGTYSSWSAYAQVAWRLAESGTAAMFKPYARVERIDLEEGDPLFDGDSDMDRALGGMRVDLTPNLALKLEYILTEWEDKEDKREVVLQAVMTW